VRDHPNAQRIWLARVDLGDGQWPVQIIFGGEYKVRPGESVAVAKPGVRTYVSSDDGRLRRKRMRKRNYRGQPSHGMFCSLDELKWFTGGPDEVAILHGLRPGFQLDCLPPHRRADYVVRPHSLSNWDTLEQATTVVMDVIKDDQSGSHEVDRSVAMN